MKEALITLALGIVGLIALIVIVNLDAISAGLRTLGLMLMLWLEITLYGLLGIGVVFLAVVAYAYWEKRRDNALRAIDGSFRLQRIRRRGGVEIVIDPNKMISSAGAYHPAYGWTEFEPAGGWERASQQAIAVQPTRTAAALTPGDGAISSQHGSHYRPGGYRSAAAAAKQLGQQASKATQRPTPATIEQQPTPPARQLSLADGMSQAQGDRLVLGYSPETGDPAIVDLVEATHIGIVGATGTGKTAGAGMLAAIQARRAGYHLAILDPKGGLDWSKFGRVGEWHETDPHSYPEQLQQIYEEHERRIAILRRMGAANIRQATGGQLAPILVVIEELGDIRRKMEQMKSRKALGQTDWILESLISTSRATGIHLLLIDQYAKRWPGPVMAGTKAKVVYKVGPNQGGIVGEYAAEHLPKRGAFILEGDEYRSWDASSQIAGLLEATPGTDYQIIEESSIWADPGEDGDDTPRQETITVHPSTRPRTEEGGGAARGDRPVDTPADGPGGHPSGQPAPDEDDATRKRRIAFAWFDAHAADLDEISHRAAAERITEETGEEIGKSYAHRLRGEWEAERASQPPPPPAQPRPTARRMERDDRARVRIVLDANNPADAAEIARIGAELEGRRDVKPAV